jgi:hypothetical protein
METLCIVTATTGNPYLSNCIQSVHIQTHPLHHLIVIDGPEYTRDASFIIDSLPPPPHIKRSVIQLHENTGKEYVCHRIIAAAAFLCNEKWISYLDEDNMLHQDYSEMVMTALTRNPKASWGFVLRCIIDADGKYICDDICESLGSIMPTYSGIHVNDRLVDTNCMLWSVPAAVKYASCWYKKARVHGVLDGDRTVTQAALANEVGAHFSILKPLIKYRCTNIQRQTYFLHGNDKYSHLSGIVTTTNPFVYVFHFDRERTHLLFNRSDHTPLQEWCMTLIDLLKDSFICLNGFASHGIFHPGSLILLNVCHPDMLPIASIVEQAKRYNCTVIHNSSLESPNCRHQQQFSKEYLQQFDHILTFWDHILETFPTKAVYMPHNARFFSHAHTVNAACKQYDTADKRPFSVSLCLACRPYNMTYCINGIELHALDYKRETYIRGLRNALVHGHGWKEACSRWTDADKQHCVVEDIANRMDDPIHPIQVYNRSTFALIVENCDAAGYVSEKVQDCFLAGTIPIYVGHDPSTILPSGTYIDGSGFEDGYELQQYIDTLTHTEVSAYKAEIQNKRLHFILNRGSQALLRAVEQIVAIKYSSSQQSYTHLS